MKKLFFLALITGAAFTSCTKSKNTPKPQTANTVTINGTAYATAVIGSQTWTTVNYNGSGGVNYNNTSTNDPANGKLYTLVEANAITLPTGWRIPSQDDFGLLLAAEGATTKDTNGYYVVPASVAFKLMAKTKWTVGGGTNSSGFNALPSGYNHHTTFDGSGTDAIFITTSYLNYWSNVKIPASLNIYQDTTVTSAGFTDVVVAPTDRGSLRFVKDN